MMHDTGEDRGRAKIQSLSSTGSAVERNQRAEIAKGLAVPNEVSLHRGVHAFFIQRKSGKTPRDILSSVSAIFLRD